MNHIEAMKQALEALENAEDLIEHQYTGTREAMSYLQNTADDAQEALTALRAAVEQAEKQAQIGTLSIWVYKGLVNYDFSYTGNLPDGDYKVYTHPAPAQPVQEPHPACKSDMLVNSGALNLALNSLRRGTQSQKEIADELERTAQPALKPLSDAPLHLLNLVKALESAFISTWQSTAGWQKELDAASEYLTAHGIKGQA